MKKIVENTIEYAWKIHYKKKYSNYLKETIKEPIKEIPEEVTAKEVNKVWGKYCHVDPRWAQYYYTMNGIASPNYVSSEVWFGKICRILNQRKRYPYPMLQDKNYLDLLFSDLVETPNVLLRNINGQLLNNQFYPVSENEAIKWLCDTQTEVVIKPSVESKGGRAVAFVSHIGDNEQFYNQLFKTIHNNKDYVVQNVVTQHSAMAKLNPNSINTIRILTLLWNEKVYLLGALVRIGVKGIRVDNPHTSNGVSCALDENGKMIKTAYDRDWYPHVKLPNGIVFEGYQVPYYSDLINTAKRLHYKTPHTRVVGWDMTVTEDGRPILIEANLDTPEIYFHQIGTGPIFNKSGLLDEVMSYVINN